MSEPKFTPGPWKIHHYGAQDEWVRTGDGEPVVMVGHNRAERAPNARLIAAAPELYDVVFRLVDAPPSCAARPGKAAGYSETDPFDDCDCWACDLVKEARAALAKVTP